MKRFAFTLAEILITLGIIGVIATITVPNLISNYQKTQYAGKSKKAYSSLNQVITKLGNDYGCNGDMVCTGLFAEGVTREDLSDVITKYFNINVNCGVNADSGNKCFPKETNMNYDGSSSTFDYMYLWGGPKFMTTDGISFYIADYTTNGYPDCTYGENICARIFIDINGPKKPNFHGRDVFTFNLLKNGKLMPYGDSSWKDHCKDDKDKLGQFCTGRIMQEGWEMNY